MGMELMARYSIPPDQRPTLPSVPILSTAEAPMIGLRCWSYIRTAPEDRRLTKTGG